MWESNGDGVLVRKKKKKKSNEETNYLFDARSRDDDDSDCNKVTKSTERIIANESTATCLRTTRRTKRTTGKQEETTTLRETTTTTSGDVGGNGRADALDSKEEDDDDDDDDDPSSHKRDEKGGEGLKKERKKYVSTENTTTEDSGGKKNEEDAPEEKEKKGEEKEDEEEAVKGVLPSFVEPMPTKAAEKQRKRGKPQYLKPQPTCFYCKTNSHRVEANTLSLDHCNAFINDVNSKPINAIKFKFMDGTIERLAVERALIKEVSSCVTNSKEENNVHGPVTGAEVVELNQGVATVPAPLVKQKSKQPVAAARVSYTEKFKELQKLQQAQYVASDGTGIFDAAALLSSFSHGMQERSGKKSGRRKMKGTSYAEASKKSKAEKEGRDVAKESNRNENREESGEKAKTITMPTKEEHESFVSTETKTTTSNEKASMYSTEGVKFQRVEPPSDHEAPVLKPKRGQFKNNASFSITRAMIEQRFHMPLIEAAKELKVGRTTFKRVLRSYGIERWPSQSIYNKAMRAIQSLMSLPMSTLQTNLKAQTLDVPNANTASQGELRYQ